MVNTITVQSVTGIDAGMTKTFGPQRSVSARVEHSQQHVKDNFGNVRVATHRIFTETEVKLSDRIWLEGADATDENEAERAVAVWNASTPSGYTLYEVWL